MSDRERVCRLLHEYFRGFDERRADETFLRTLFTPDATVEFPVGSATGLEEMARVRRDAMGLWRRTLHMVGTELVAVAGERAEVSAVLHATHLHHGDERTPLQIGANLTAAAVRAGEDWRLSRLALELVWSAGDGPER